MQDNANRVVLDTLKAVETIVEKAIGKVSFDKTETCEIIKEYDNEKGKYLVSNGTLKFDAKSVDINKTYNKNQTVYVTIPGGDYTKDKIIIGSIYNEEDIKGLYIDPFDDLISYRSFKLNDVWVPQDYVPAFGKPDYIGFQLAFNNIEKIENYKIGIKLMDENGNTLLNTNYLYFYSDEILGNPKEMVNNFYHKKLFSFPNIELTDIKTMQFDVPTGIELSDAKVTFGYSASNKNLNDIELGSVRITCDQSLEYKGDEGNEDSLEKILNLEWHDGTQIYNKYNLPENITTYWCWADIGTYANKIKYDRDNKIIPKDYRGTYWNILDNTKDLWILQPILDIGNNKTSNEYKAIIVKEEVDKSEIYLSSNTISFLRTDRQAIDGQDYSDLPQSLKLKLNTGNTGYHPVYNEGAMKEINEEYSVTAELDLPGAQFGVNTQITWHFPKLGTQIEPHTFLLSEEEWLIEETETETLLIYPHPDYSEEMDIAKGLTVSYGCKSLYNIGSVNNIIRCTTSEGYWGTIELTFGYARTSGTDYALNLFPSDTAILAEDGATLEIEAVLTYNQMPIENLGELQCSWEFFSGGSGLVLCKEDGTELQEEEKTSKIIIKYLSSDARYNGDKHTDTCFSILKATISDWTNTNGTKVNLITYLPIAIKSSNELSYITGATSVIYNTFGEPQFNSEPYVLYNSQGKAIDKIVQWDAGSTNIISSSLYAPTISYDGNLNPYPLYSSDYLVAAVRINRAKYKTFPYINYNWYQPLLINNNGYWSNSLNQWDGSLVIDNKYNYIFSSMLGAGVKLPDNTFSGVLMGDVGKVDSNGKKISSYIGLYGFKYGQKRFSFTENGEAFIGNNNSYLSIDILGNFNFVTKDGHFYVGDEHKTKYIEYKDGNFVVSGEIRATSGTIGGWSLETNGDLVSYTTDGSSFRLTTRADNNAWIEAKNGPKKYFPFYVTKEGVLHATEAIISGTIHADEGTIGYRGLTISDYGLYAEDKAADGGLHKILTFEKDYDDPNVFGDDTESAYAPIVWLGDWSRRPTSNGYYQRVGVTEGRLIFVKSMDKDYKVAEQTALNYNILMAIKTK